MIKYTKLTVIAFILLGISYEVKAQDVIAPSPTIEVKPKARGVDYYPFGSIGDTTRGIFGKDDRYDLNQVYGYKDYARATLTMVSKKVMKGDKIYAWDLRTKLTKRFNKTSFNSNVKFLNQPTCGTCTGFLIAPDILVTAGHCVKNLKDGKKFEWIMDYTNKLYYNKSKKYIVVPQRLRYTVKEVLATRLDKKSTGYDYAILRLDRKTDRKPYRFRTSGKVTSFSKIFTIGSPTGLPMKLAKNAYVTSNKHYSYFIDNLDGFPGNSGGPVFSSNGFIEGILVRGAVKQISKYSKKRTGDYYYDNVSKTIKTLTFKSHYGNAGSHAHRITHMPQKYLLMAIYDNMEYAIKKKNNKRLKDWIIYYPNFKLAYFKTRENLLLLASRTGNNFAVNELIKVGMDISVVDGKGNGMLHWAAKNKNSASISSLLKSGLSSNLKNKDGYTPMYYAIVNNDLSSLKLMVERGGDINMLDNYQNNLMHIAVKQGNMAMVQYLDSKNVNLSQKNFLGYTPKKYAKKLKFKKIKKYIKKAEKRR